jgi:hypothetical protein
MYPKQCLSILWNKVTDYEARGFQEFQALPSHSTQPNNQNRRLLPHRVAEYNELVLTDKTEQPNNLFKQLDFW